MATKKRRAPNHRKSGPRPDLDFSRIKDEYETTVAAVAMLARKWGTTRNTIMAHIKKEGWKAASRLPEPLPPDPISEAAKRTNAVIDIKTRKRLAEIINEKPGKIDANDALDLIADAIAQHTLLEGELLAYARRLLQRAQKNELRPGKATSEAEEARSVMSAIATALELSRELRGLRPGTPSVGDGDVSRDPDVHFELPDLEDESEAS